MATLTGRQNREHVVLNRIVLDISQRVNLVSRSARVTGLTPVFDVSDPSRPVGVPRDTALSQLNADLVDVGFVDEPIQCDPEVCAEVKQNYKFVERKDWSQCNR